MISISNILNDSDEQSGGLDYLPNSRYLGNVSVVAGRYYLVAFSLKTSTLNAPWLMSAISEEGLTVAPIVKTIINTSTPLSPNYPALTNVYRSISTYLYGGYCTESNNWGLTVTFGQCSFSSFAYSIDEVFGSSSSPILQPAAFQQLNQGTLTAPASGNVTYMVGMSMIPYQSYPTTLNPNWIQLSRCHDESIVPNLFTGYSSIGDTTLGWTDGLSVLPPPPVNAQPYQEGAQYDQYPFQGVYLERALLACEIESM